MRGEALLGHPHRAQQVHVHLLRGRVSGHHTSDHPHLGLDLTHSLPVELTADPGIFYQVIQPALRHFLLHEPVLYVYGFKAYLSEIAAASI